MWLGWQCFSWTLVQFCWAASRSSGQFLKARRSFNRLQSIYQRERFNKRPWQGYTCYQIIVHDYTNVLCSSLEVVPIKSKILKMVSSPRLKFFLSLFSLFIQVCVECTPRKFNLYFTLAAKTKLIFRVFLHFEGGDFKGKTWLWAPEWSTTHFSWSRITRRYYWCTIKTGKRDYRRAAQTSGIYIFSFVLCLNWLSCSLCIFFKEQLGHFIWAYTAFLHY